MEESEKYPSMWFFYGSCLEDMFCGADTVFVWYGIQRLLFLVMIPVVTVLSCSVYVEFRTLNLAILFSLMVCSVIVSIFRFFRFSVVPEGGSVAMDNAEAEGVMADVSSNLSMSSCAFIFSDAIVLFCFTKAD